MIDFSNIKTYPIERRGNKAETKDFGHPGTIEQLIPNILAGKQFKDMIEATATAARNNKMILVMMGGHVIKCGLSPLLIDLIERGIIKHIAMNGAASIHDFEIAFQGATSEDVQKGLKDGSFGMVEETGKLMNEAINDAFQLDYGQGLALGKKISDGKYPNKQFSILHSSYHKKIPASVHVALGTDIIHQHPTCNGAAVGETTMRDFKLLTESVSKLEGGVVLNFGSAVIMPETFLKALTIARNLGHSVRHFTAVNFDMYSQYRPNTNVVQRPTADGGTGYSFIGQHEILIPLFYSLLMHRLGDTHA